jgi:predicted permease
MWKRLNALVKHDELDRGLNAEVRFHIEMETEKNIRLGMSPDDARRTALANFGPMEKHKAETRDARGVSWLENVIVDLRYGVRSMLKHPGYAALAILTLGLGIGANTAIFSVIDGVLLKPLPYAHGDRLVLIQEKTPLQRQQTIGVSITELYDYRQQLQSFEGIVEHHLMSFDLLRRGEPDRVAAAVVSPNFFDVLGVKPLLGRTFVDADDDHGADAVLVISHAYWQTKFGGDPTIVGQVFQMNDRPHTVVGVLPSIPQYPQDADVYMPTSACPFRAQAEDLIATQRRPFQVTVFGLLKPGVSLATANAEVQTVAKRFAVDFPQVYTPEKTGFYGTTASVVTELTRNARQMLLVLLGTTGLVLLIACANVANLTLARMLKRDRELAMRAALGAGRSRLVRQLLTESVVLAVAGGAIGLVFAWSTIGMLTTFVGRFTARTHQIAIDPGVLGFTLMIAIATGLIFGTLPALASRSNPMTALKTGSKGTESTGRRRIQDALIVAQVAVSVVLLVGAGLLLVSFYRLQNVQQGFNSERITTAEVFGNFTKYPNPADLLGFYDRVLQRLNTAPGVVSASITNAIPLTGLVPGQTRFQIEGHTYDTPDARPTVDVRVASPKYFETLGVPLMKGRTFSDLDHSEAPLVGIINETMAKHWGDQDPIGTHVSFDNGKTWGTIVGIVSDIKTFGLDKEPAPQLYRPLAQSGGIRGRVMVRMTGDPQAAITTIHNVVRSLDPDIPIENVRTLDEIRTQYLATPKLTAMLLTVFAGLSLLVTLTGIAGVIAQSVSQRTQEFGLRMALGATRDSVLVMVLRQGVLLVGIGLVIGVAGAFATGRVLNAYLYATAPHDPLIYASVAGMFILSGIIACLIPARRATTVDPLIALRAE